MSDLVRCLDGDGVWRGRLARCSSGALATCGEGEPCPPRAGCTLCQEEAPFDPLRNAARGYSVVISGHAICFDCFTPAICQDISVIPTRVDSFAPCVGAFDLACNHGNCSWRERAASVGGGSYTQFQGFTCAANPITTPVPARPIMFGLGTVPSPDPFHPDAVGLLTLPTIAAFAASTLVLQSVERIRSVGTGRSEVACGATWTFSRTFPTPCSCPSGGRETGTIVATATPYF